ncbi:hypothetical protein LSAT2_014927, partial [Lamellibrachia satsuma]
LEWAESTVADFNSDSEMGRTIRLRGPNRLGRTIRRRGPNPSWAEPSGTPRAGLGLRIRAIRSTDYRPGNQPVKHCDLPSTAHQPDSSQLEELGRSGNRMES